MSLIVPEAALLAAKEALKLWAVGYAVSSAAGGRGRASMLKAMGIGALAASALVPVSLALIDGPAGADFLSRLSSYVFFLLFLASSITLVKFPDASIEGAEGILPRAAMAVVVFVAFSASSMGTAAYLREMGSLKVSQQAVFASAIAGFVAVSAVGLWAMRRASEAVGRCFGPGQILLLLALMHLLGGGTRGIDEMSMVPSVQMGVSKFTHDIMHLTLVMLMVPDHPILQMSTWNFLGFFFGPSFSVAMALCLLALPPAYFLYHSAVSPLPAPGGAATGAERRLARHAERVRRAHRAIPVAVFLAVVMMSWYTGGGERASALYIPAPIPLVADKGDLIIPLTDPVMDLSDGRIHKFIFDDGPDHIRFLVVRKPDGHYSVCLDACEICPPDGYGQSEGHVVCVYCMTPIPLDTLGEPGGCNPIPLRAEVTESAIRVNAAEAAAKWRKYAAGAAGESGKEGR